VPADRAACLGVFDSNVPESFDLAERREFAEYLDHLPGPYLVLLDEQGRIHACGGWARADDPGRADLCWGMVRRSLQGEGWGRALTLARLDRVATARDLDRIRLQTSQDTEGFYLRLGFVVIEREAGGFRPGLDRVVMERPARPAPRP
jgi:ribosomal protein S18 acetylase RimI-like enzyme